MKKYFSILLAAVLLLGSLGISANAFSDITDPDTARDVSVLQQLGIINGVGGDRFNPSGALTRSQFCKMAVCALDKAGEAAQYSNSSIFTDVRGSYWASGYIHYCVKNGMVLGIGDGSFAPERQISFAEAVTVLMRSIGYKDTDFTLSWPQGYMAEAASIGLTKGLSLNANSILNRAQAAKLFKNLLLTETKTGASFAASVFGGLTEDALITDVDADGVTCFDGAQLTKLSVATAVDSNLIGSTCRFITDSKGKVRAAIAVDDLYTRETATVSEAQYTGITDTTGKRYAINSKTLFYIDGALKDYSTAWLSIKAGSIITVYSDLNGICKLILMESNTSTASSIIVLKSTPSGMQSLAYQFGLDGSLSYTLFKNGNVSDASKLAPYDVVVYNKNTRTFYASDFKLTGYYEAAWPNNETPVKMTMYGKEFDLTPYAQEQLRLISKGSSVTALITDDLKIAAVLQAKELSVVQTGFVSNIGTSTATITFSNGLELTSPSTNTQASLENLLGTLVTVSAPKSGYMSLSKMTLTAPGKSLNLTSRTLGEHSISPSCTVYDSINGLCLRNVKLSDIKLTEIQPNNVLHAGFDSLGNVNLLVLNDTTGLCYQYGILSYEYKETGYLGGLTAYNNALGVKNSSDAAVTFIFGQAQKSMNGQFGGIAVSGEYVKSYVILKSVKCSRSDFQDGYVIADGVVLPLASDLKYYIKDTNSWVETLEEVRTYSNELTVYYDKDPAQGGQARIIAAQ